MIRRSSPLPALLLLALVAPLRGQTADTVTVGVGGELSQVVGEYLLVPIYADMSRAGGEKLGSYTIRVTWDPDTLQYDAIVSGSFADGRVNTDSAWSYGVLWMTAVSPSGLDGTFDLASLRFYHWQTGTSPVDLTVTELSAAGTLTDLLATATVQVVNGTFCTARGRWGDMDGDGLANSRDALAILSAAVGIDVSATFDLTLGDVGNDGVTDTRDALILLSYAVGIDITGQRVLLTAPGACGTGSPPSVVIEPDTADVVVGQAVQLQARTRDASGGFTTVTGVNWAVDDPAIAAVTADGILTGRVEGSTAVHAALGPGVTVSGTVIVSARRPVWHVNAAVAKGRATQLGNQAYPFSTVERAFPLVSEGDTIRVAPGIHDYESLGSNLSVGVVIEGDTLADGTRPILRAPPDLALTAFNWQGGVRGEVRNLVLEGFDEVVYGYGIRTLALENVRVVDPTRVWGDAVYVYGGIDTLLVRNSELLGDSAFQSGLAIYVSDGADLVSVHDTRIVNWGGGGIQGYDIDSLDVQRSVIGPTEGYGVYSYASNRPSVAAAVTQTRFIDNYYNAIYLSNARRLAMSGNYIDQRRDDAVYAYGVYPTVAGTRFTSVNDTIDFRADGWDWTYVWYFDSVAVDGLLLQSPADTATWQWGSVGANYVAVTNSRFLNLYGTALTVDARELAVDNSEFTGCAVCNWLDAAAIETSSFMDSGPRASVTNSTFYNLEWGYYNTWSNDSVGAVTFVGNTLDSVGTGIRFKADSAYVADNVLTRVRTYGIYADQSFSGRPPGRATIERNSVTCSVQASYTAYGIYTGAVPPTIDNNAVRDCDYGIYSSYGTGYQLDDYFARGDTVFMPTDGSGQYGIYMYGRFGYSGVVRNTVRRGGTGMYLLPDVNPAVGDTIYMRVDTNAVSETAYQGVYLYPYDVASVYGVRNNIANNLGYGIYNAGSGTRSFTLGSFTGNASWAIYNSIVFDATQNWWGSANGAGGQNGSGLADADSVSSATTDTGTPLTTAPGDVPPLAPPVFAPVVNSAPLAGEPTGPPEPLADPNGRLQAERRAGHEGELAARTTVKREAWDRLMAFLERIRAERHQGGDGGNR